MIDDSCLGNWHLTFVGIYLYILPGKPLASLSEI